MAKGSGTTRSGSSSNPTATGRGSYIQVVNSIVNAPERI